MASADDSTSTDRTPNGDADTIEGKPVKIPYPKSILFIISTEFCERFSFYGMRAILVLYFTSKLMLSDNDATVLYHTFTTLAYFVPIFGAIISDSWLGKSKTISYFSMVYAAGSTIIALGAIPTLNLPATATTITGLLLIAIGDGGIKPCVAAFGGDQFQLPEQLAQMATFFSVFYFAINAGSLISTFVTPILRQDVRCFDANDCYSLAFGVPAVLMIAAITLFLCGKPFYKNVPTSGNMVTKVTECITNAIATRGREKYTRPREHWLDYSEEKYGKQLVDDIKVVLKVLVLYIPLPFFWALYDQQGSRWTMQATRMDGNIGFYDIKPDQMQVINPFLILSFIPLFETLIYPLLSKIGIRRPLQKLTVGGLLAAAAFLLSGLVELELEKTYPLLPAEGQAQYRFINGLPCNFTARTTIPASENFPLKQFEMYAEEYIDVQKSANYNFVFETTDPNCPRQIEGEVILTSKNATTVFISGSEIGKADVYEDDPQKSRTPMLRVLFSSLGTTPLRNFQIIYKGLALFSGNSTSRELFSVSAGELEVNVDGQNYGTITLAGGSVSALIVLDTPDQKSAFQLHLIQITAPNSMNILWLLPQNILMTMAEVMFSVTGLEFSYAEAPASMKSVLQACWLLTTAFGNIIIMVIAGAKFFESQADEFFLFMGLMVLDMLFFMVLAKKYNRGSDAGRGSDIK